MSQAAACLMHDEFSCAPGIVWVRDADRVLLANPAMGKSWSLGETEAALWDWLAMGYTYTEVVRLMSLALRISQSEAGETTRDVLLRWHGEGILARPPRDRQVSKSLKGDG